MAPARAGGFLPSRGRAIAANGEGDMERCDEAAKPAELQGMRKKRVPAKLPSGAPGQAPARGTRHNTHHANTREGAGLRWPPRTIDGPGPPNRRS